MAFDLSKLNVYVEENRLPLLAESILKGNSVAKFNLMTGVKTSSKLNIISTNPVLQAGDCSFTPAGDTVLSQRQVDTKQCKVNMEWCEKDLLAYWTQYAVRCGLADDSIAFEEYFTKQIIDNVKLQIEKTVWQGDVEGDYMFDGLIKILGEAEGVVKPTVAEGSSAYEAIKAVYMAIPEEILDRAVVMVGADTFRAYMQELVEKNYYHYEANGMPAEEFVIPGTNTKVIALNGLNGTKAIVAGALDNFYYATDMVNDSETFDLWFSKDNRTHRLAIEFNAGVQVAFPNEVVLATIA